MLEDRDYMRAPEFREPAWRGPRWSWTMFLLAAYAVFFLGELFVVRFAPGNSSVFGYLALSKEGLGRGYVWQLLTYQFMHAGWLHLFFNGWAIYVFGSAVEAALGGKKFITLVLTSGVIGGIFQVLAATLWPNHFGGPVVGASAGALGLMAAYAVLFPERELMLLLFFVVPVRLSAKALLILSAVLALLGIVFPISNIANAAHLGGMLTGVVFIRQFVQGHWMQRQSISRPIPPRKSEKDLSTGEFLQKEVDPILDKISAQGIQSLTERERKILEKARAKMTKT